MVHIEQSYHNIFCSLENRPRDHNSHLQSYGDTTDAACNMRLGVVSGTTPMYCQEMRMPTKRQNSSIQVCKSTPLP